MVVANAQDRKDRFKRYDESRNAVRYSRLQDYEIFELFSNFYKGCHLLCRTNGFAVSPDNACPR
jgi:hypothetical protein